MVTVLDAVTSVVNPSPAQIMLKKLLSERNDLERALQAYNKGYWNSQELVKALNKLLFPATIR